MRASTLSATLLAVMATPLLAMLMEGCGQKPTPNGDSLDTFMRQYSSSITARPTTYEVTLYEDGKEIGQWILDDYPHPVPRGKTQLRFSNHNNSLTLVNDRNTPILHISGTFVVKKL